MDGIEKYLYTDQPVTLLLGRRRIKGLRLREFRRINEIAVKPPRDSDSCQEFQYTGRFSLILSLEGFEKGRT